MVVLVVQHIELIPAVANDRARLAALFELYVYDLSEFLGLDIGDDGRFRVPPLDSWFADPCCHAFLVRVDGTLAGFALVQRPQQAERRRLGHRCRRVLRRP